MRLTFAYGTHALLLPASVLAHLEKAGKKDIRILLELAAEPLSQTDLAAASAAVAARTGLKVSELETAIAFWRGTGVIAGDESETDEQQSPATQLTAPQAVTPRVLSDKGLPAYSTEELSSILERRRGFSSLIDDCQQAFGKIFNTGEIGIIAGLADYLGLDEEYILLLLTHCRSMGKKSLRYVEKMAITLHDEGIHDARDLEQRLHRIEVMADATGRVRALFGITSRALTTKEKAVLENWICNMQYGEEMLQRAYEMTVDAIGKASIPYANKILERWYADGYRTVEDVERALADYKRKKAGDGASFDVDEFFEAALRRTYGDSK